MPANVHLPLLTRVALGPILALTVGFVALTASPTSGAPKAGRNVNEAAAVSMVAAQKAKVGEYKLCRDLFRQAYQLDPSYLGYLYSAGRCAQKANDLDAAEHDYRAFLARATAGHALRDRATGHLDEIFAARNKAAAEQAAADKVAAEKAAADKAAANNGAANKGAANNGANGQTSAGNGGAAGVHSVEPPADGRTWLTRGLFAGGGLAVAGGAVLVALAVSDRAALQDRLAPEPGKELVWKLNRATAQSEADAIDGRVQLGVGVAAAGVALVGGGLYVWLTRPKADRSARLLPTGRGLALQVAWR